MRLCLHRIIAGQGCVAPGIGRRDDARVVEGTSSWLEGRRAIASDVHSAVLLPTKQVIAPPNRS